MLNFKKIIEIIKPLISPSKVKVSHEPKTNLNVGGLGVSLNTVVYPDNIVCKCGSQVEVNPQTIDIGTWNLKCKCGKVAYYHPKRHERQQQLGAMLDF